MCITPFKLHYLIIVLLLSSVAYCAYCHGKPRENAPLNVNPIYTNDPTLLKTSPNGKLYTVGVENRMYVLHLFGTPYEQGYAHGQLLKDEVKELIESVWKYVENEAEGALKSLPQWLRQLIADYGLAAALDITYEITVKYTGSYFYEEMKGLSDASGVDYKTIRRIHMIGELAKAHCSMFGAWGEATKSTGKTIQIRALDWITDGPFQDHPMITIYHPKNTTYGQPFANAGFVGWIGALSGMSSAQMAISEIGVTFPDDTFGSESRFGIPFTYLLRDILQFDYTLDDSIDRITRAKRTCNLILGVGDGKLQEFRGFQYSSSVANVIDDYNLIPKNDTWHPKIKNVVYFGMDWLCPPFSQKLGERLQLHHGNITVENTISDIVPKTSTGSLQVAVYDLTETVMYISYARRTGGTGPQYAYDRQYVKLDLKSMFKESAP